MNAIDLIVRDVAELPDRDSPEGQPEIMLVTGDELRRIVLRRLPSAWQPIDTAPRDGTLLLLLIGPAEREQPIEDTAGPSRTIGHNNFDNDGEDVWAFAGWCWNHDHYTEGKGKPVAWQPFPETEVPCEGAKP